MRTKANERRMHKLLGTKAPKECHTGVAIPESGLRVKFVNWLRPIHTYTYSPNSFSCRASCSVVSKGPCASGSAPLAAVMIHFCAPAAVTVHVAFAALVRNKYSRSMFLHMFALRGFCSRCCLWVAPGSLLGVCWVSSGCFLDVS
jgi:hypothetical protein